MRFSANFFYRLFSCLAVAMLIAMAAVSIYCAFLGAAAAEKIFNSSVAGACWTVLFFLLLAAVVWNLAGRRKIFVVMTHLGCAAVILGAVLGSERFCQWRGLTPVWAEAKISPGQYAKLGDIVMKLHRVSAEYYPVEHPMLAWRIYFESRLPDGRVELSPVQNVNGLPIPVNGFVVPGKEIMCEKFDWIISDGFRVPQMIWPSEKGWQRVPLLKDKPMDILTGMFFRRKANVDKFYVNLRPDVDSQGQPVAVESDDGRLNPAVSLIDDEGKTYYLLSPGETTRLNRVSQDGRMLMYLPVRINRGGRACPFAAMLQLRRGTEVTTGIIAGREEDRMVRLSLVSLYPTEEQWIFAGRPGLVFRLEQPEKQVYADLIFDAKDKLTAGVNSPVSYGGYDFCLAGYDLESGEVTIFARRNYCLWLVWSGFALLAAGLTGWCVAGLIRSRRGGECI